MPVNRLEYVALNTGTGVGSVSQFEPLRFMGGQEQSGESAVIQDQKMALQPPRMFRVLILNDDFTPMEFVVDVLQRFFSMDREQATRVMLKVHCEGKGFCGTYPKDIAATKVDQVVSFARDHQHPLACTMEEE